MTADLALDGGGFGTGAYGLGYCAHTDAPATAVAHWIVDLGKRHHILNVTIYNRQGKFSLKLLF